MFTVFFLYMFRFFIQIVNFENNEISRDWTNVWPYFLSEQSIEANRFVKTEAKFEYCGQT